jgi:hypothetical protein
MKHRKAEAQTLQDLEQLAEKLKREGRLPSLERLAEVLHVIAEGVKSGHRKPGRKHRPPRPGPKKQAK